MAKTQTRDVQMNVRLTPEDEQRIDMKRIKLQAELGRIPSRSEIVRMALDKFLGPALAVGRRKKARI